MVQKYILELHPALLNIKIGRNFKFKLMKLL